MMRAVWSIIGCVALVLWPAPAPAQQKVLQDREVTVIYSPSLDSAAREIMRMYPSSKLELEELFDWGLDIRPQVLLFGDSRQFAKASGSNLFVAFAVPEKNLIAIDYSRMNIHPFTLNTTLKHELCHLLLHQHVNRQDLPRWLDEGVCQWASDGLGELFVEQNLSGLDAAVMSGRVIPFAQLNDYFPRDKAALMLAYEQSKSMISYIERQYGNYAIRSLMDHLKNGDTVNEAVTGSLGISFVRLENQWLDFLESAPRWLLFLTRNIYGILFFLAGILTFVGFVRLMRRRRKLYEEWEEDE